MNVFWWRERNLNDVINKAPVMSSEKIMEALAVPPETPIVQAVLNVLAGLEEIAKEQTAIPKLRIARGPITLAGLGVWRKRNSELTRS
jgi:hypothetical protein